MIIDWIVCAILFYFVIAYGGNLLLNLLALYGMRRIDQAKVLADLPHIHSGLEPPISVLLTTRDQAYSIAPAVRKLLELHYPQFEVIVVNDGSLDDTMHVLTEAFELLPFPEAYRIQLPTQGVTTIYRSTRYPHLRVIDQSAGGEADALNAAVNAARFPLLCAMDADIVLEQDCLHRVALPFLGNADTIAAIGAIRLTSDGSANRWMSRLQTVQHLRRNLFAPLGWSVARALVAVPPGIQLLLKDVVIEAGGYRTDALDAKMDLVMRMHGVASSGQQSHHIRFVSDTVGWKKSLMNIHTIKTSRIRMQSVLADCMRSNTALLSNKHCTMRSRIAFIFLSLSEWFGPLIEAASYVLIVAALFAGWIPASTFGAFFMVTIGMGILLSMSGLLLEEISGQAERQPDNAGMWIATAVLENVGYRQIDAYWRTLGLMQSRPESQND
jgi:cellulose synthase/poly-beta-1,6-N-acetylglucosamine synthase-like glycosyltransferase